MWSRCYNATHNAKGESGLSIIEYALCLALLLLLWFSAAMPDFKDALERRIEAAHNTAATALPCEVDLSGDRCL